MSKNLSEPSTQRFINSHGYRISQLERRPSLVRVVPTWGLAGYDIPLFWMGRANNTDVSGVRWEHDVTSSDGGYVSNENLGPADGDYFTVLVPAWPPGSIWGLHYRYYLGPDFGNVRVKIASLAYESEDRPSGDPAGKIQPDAFGSWSPVPAPSYINLAAVDNGFNAVQQETFTSGTKQFIPGGEVGDVLTSLSAGGSDPFTGFNISDGGAGWYRLKFIIEGKSASSTGFKMRIVRATWARETDDGAP